MIRYTVPWDLVLGLTPHLVRGTRESITDFTAAICSRMKPAPRIEGLHRLPEDPRFVLIANHYQRPGLWILHTAAVLTQAIVDRYGAGEPPVRWVVTANWPPFRCGSLRFPNPGDRLLPRVAEVLSCYPVAFAGSNPKYSSASIRRILRESRGWNRPLGIFPEGVGGVAGVLSAPLPGSGRLIRHLAERGMPVVPAAVSEPDGVLVEFGERIPVAELVEAQDAAELALSRVESILMMSPRQARLSGRNCGSV